jgi:hypothetical protein
MLLMLIPYCLGLVVNLQYDVELVCYLIHICSRFSDTELPFMPEQNKCIILCPKIHCWGALITFSLVNGALSVTFLIKYRN